MQEPGCCPIASMPRRHPKMTTTLVLTACKANCGDCMQNAEGGLGREWRGHGLASASPQAYKFVASSDL